MRLRALAVVTIFVGFCSAQTSIGKLTVTVEDATGAIIPGASIRLQHWEYDHGQHARLVQDVTVTTDAQRHMSGELQPGVYDLFVSASAFEPVAKSVKIESGKQTQVISKLKMNRYVSFAD